MRRSESKQKLYRVEKSGLKTATRMMIFLSFVIIFAGLLSRGGGDLDLTVTPSATPSPTPLTETFDETVETKEITLPETVWYAIQMGAFESEEAAKTLAATYQNRGAAGYVMFQENRYRVLASVYPNKDDAQTVRTQLKTSHEIDSYVHEVAMPELTLKLTGMKGQIDIIEAALRFFPDALTQLQKMSIALDRKEANQQEVANELHVLCARAEELISVFSKRFTSPKHIMVERIEHLLSLYRQLEGAINADETLAVALAASLKYQTLAMIDSTISFLQQMAQ